MEPEVDFLEISLLKDDGQVTSPMKEKEFYEWLRDTDFKLDFERKLKAELEKVNDDSLCICKQRTLSKESPDGNTIVSNFRI
jgi:hypothetical protein